MVVGGKRRALSIVATVVIAVALAVAITGRGCRDDDESPDGVARAFARAARAGDEKTAWELLGPATRARVEAAAQAATEKVGGARRFAPLDVLELSASESSHAPAEFVVRERGEERAVVEIVGVDGRRDRVTAVRVDGRWRVELDW